MKNGDYSYSYSPHDLSTIASNVVIIVNYYFQTIFFEFNAFIKVDFNFIGLRQNLIMKPFLQNIIGGDYVIAIIKNFNSMTCSIMFTVF